MWKRARENARREMLSVSIAEMKNAKSQSEAGTDMQKEVFQLQLKNVARWSEHCKTAMGKSIIIEFRATNTDYRINEYELSI